MGIETAIIAGLGLASAIGNFNQQKSEARQTAHHGTIEAAKRANEIKSLAAKQRVSYLQAGLELEGTPQAVINDTYNTGMQDIHAISEGYNQQSKNIMNKARANLLGDIAKVGVSAFAGESGLEDMGGTKSLTSQSYFNGLIGGNITGTIPVQPRKPLFTGSM